MFNRILVPIDLDDRMSADRIIDTAAELAEKQGGELHVLTVVPSFSMAIVGSFFPKDHEHQALEAAQAALKSYLSSKALPNLHGHVAHGTIYDEIMKTADKLDCDLIVMAAHRPELKDYLLGPNAARVVRHARQSVVVIRSDT